MEGERRLRTSVWFAGWVTVAFLGGCGGIAGSATDGDRAAALRPHAAEWERLVEAEDGRGSAPGQIEVLEAGARSDDPRIRAIAVRGMGRLERPELLTRILPLLQDSDAEVRREAVRAAARAVSRPATEARAGGFGMRPLAAAPAVWEALVEALADEREGSVVAMMVETLGRLPNGAKASETIGMLLAHLDGPLESRLGAVRGLRFLAVQPQARGAFDSSAVAALAEVATRRLEDGTGGSADDVDRRAAIRIRVVAASVLGTIAPMAGASGPGGSGSAGGSTTGTDAEAAEARLALLIPALEVIAEDPEPLVRREAAFAAGAIADPAVVERLIGTLLDDRSGVVRYDALRVYGRRLAETRGCGPVRAAVRDEDVHVAKQALELLGTTCGGRAGDIAILDSIAAALPAGDGDGWHGPAQALVSLAHLDPGRATAHLEKFSTHPSLFVRAYAAQAAGATGDEARLRSLAADPHPNVRTAAVTALRAKSGSRGMDVYLAQLTEDDSQLLQAVAAALEGSTGRAAAGAILDALDRISAPRRETSRDARRALLARMRVAGGAEWADRVRPYLNDFDPEIAELAAEVLEYWTGTRPEPAPSSPTSLRLPGFEEAARLASTRVVLEMASGGEIVIRLFPFDAPTNAARLARLVQDGHFDGLTLHRVVPNFVAQGGSPNANEYAGDGPFSRDELGRSNWRGTVGLSTRGRDTGDGQLYINLIDNVRLDTDYTVFGEVVEGMGIVDRLQEGARIRRAFMR